jgi:hypothetical protein
MVLYQGTSTSLAISIFATNPLPENRTIWLQVRGWSGETGMRAKAFFGSNGGWINVTPSLRIESTSLIARKEETYQKDIARFRKRSVGKNRERHLLRETSVIRIPAEAGDGYYQFVLCAGEKKKVLCTSPTFRVASVSSSLHCLRGASLMTMPAEVGVMVGTAYVKTAAGTALASAKLGKKAMDTAQRPAFKKAATYFQNSKESKAAKLTLAAVEKGAAMAAEAASDSNDNVGLNSTPENHLLIFARK